jgi:hypothetical protein
MFWNGALAVNRLLMVQVASCAGWAARLVVADNARFA